MCMRRPPPFLQTAQMRPPCAWMMDRLIDSPMPRPVGLVVTNGSKIRSSSACSTPGPQSVTAISIVPWFVESVANGAFAPPPNDSEALVKKPSELAAEYLPRMTEAIDRAKQMSGEQLLQPIPFYSWNLPGIQYLVLGLKHSIHHRGQLSAYLRPMGGKVPGIYGPTADEPMTATQQA